MELIRDNLIQNGISFPTKSFEKYEDCFFVSERLASLSWFLFVNNVSGSTIGEGYALFPQQTYKQKIRSLVYAEYVDVGKDFAGMMLPRRRTDDVDSNFNFLSKSQARVSPFGEQYSKVESAGNEFLDLVKKSQETIEGDDFDSWDDFDVETIEQPESEEVGVSAESQTDIDIANLVEDEDGFLVDGDSQTDIDIANLVEDEDGFLVDGDSQTDIDIANLVEDEDGFLVDGDSLKADEDDSSGFEDDSNERDGWVSEDSEGDFDDWGSRGSEEDGDEFESWDDSDEDEFESWGTDTSEVEDDADFDDWGNSDEIEEDSDDWESLSEEDDSDFDDWGSSDDSEDLETDFEDDADFDDWGSDEEDEPEEELEDDADFDDWGNSDEIEEEDFDDWGSGEEDKPKVTKGTPSKQVKRSPASELKAETEMMDFFERGVNSLFRSTISNGKKFGRRFASFPENGEK